MAASSELSALLQLVSYLMREQGARAFAPPPPAEALPDALVRSHMLSPLASLAGYGHYEHDFIATSMRADVRERALSEAIGVLATASIPVALIKGVSYVGGLYESAGLRPMSDIDLLVPGHRFDAALHLLKSGGYRVVSGPGSGSRVHHAIQLMRDESIDLHRTIVQPLRSRIDLDAVWARARPAAERSDAALRLDPVDEAVFHFIHIARHELRVPAVNYVDGARLLRRLTPEQHGRMLSRARAFRVGRAVRTSVAMTHAFAAGSACIPATATSRLLPTTREILAAERAWRLLELTRKALLLDGPREFAGLAAVYVIEQLSRLSMGRTLTGM